MSAWRRCHRARTYCEHPSDASLWHQPRRRRRVPRVAIACDGSGPPLRLEADGIVTLIFLRGDAVLHHSAPPSLWVDLHTIAVPRRRIELLRADDQEREVADDRDTSEVQRFEGPPGLPYGHQAGQQGCIVLACVPSRSSRRQRKNAPNGRRRLDFFLGTFFAFQAELNNIDQHAG